MRRIRRHCLPKMRRGQFFFVLGFVLFLGFALNAFSTLISLLFEKGTADVIDGEELSDLNAPTADAGLQRIPKIIHQTYVNSSIPEKWQAGQKSCKDLHPAPEWEYKLWTDDLAHEFIAKEYTWFLPTFDAYPYPIQRADAIRYFILSHFGGIYLDLDDGCARSLEPLLVYDAWVRLTIPTGISNDAMGSVAGHPFFAKVLTKLHPFQRNWLVPYITVMYTTGPLFFSVIWKEYINSKPVGGDRVRLLMPDEYSKKPWAFFKISQGSSWHGDDAKAIFWMAKYWWLLTILGFALAGAISSCLWWICFKRSKVHSNKKGQWYFLWGSSRAKEGYELVDHIA